MTINSLPNQDFHLSYYEGDSDTCRCDNCGKDVPSDEVERIDDDLAEVCYDCCDDLLGPPEGA